MVNYLVAQISDIFNHYCSIDFGMKAGVTAKFALNDLVLCK
jgi:hypothetical protein